MSHLAYVCPGQGSQTLGMGKSLAEASPAAAAVFAEADTALGEPISDLAWAGPADRLDLTENAQPAILAHPPDVLLNGDGSRLATELDGGVLTVAFAYDW